MKIRNLDRFKRRLARIPVAVRAEVGKAIQTSGNEITQLQRGFAPKDDGVLVGTIDNSYDPTLMRATLTAGGEATTKPVREGADASYDYALGQEFGTTDMPANPYFFPGFRLGKRRAKSRISRAVRKAIKQAVG